MPKLYTANIAKNTKNEWFWNIIHRNGREICRSSETYINRSDCIKSIFHLIDGVLEGKVDIENIAVRKYRKMER